MKYFLHSKHYAGMVLLSHPVTASSFLAQLSRSDKVSFCDRLMSVRASVRQQFLFVDDRGHTFHPIFMKFCQNVCLDEIWVGIVSGSSGVKN